MDKTNGTLTPTVILASTSPRRRELLASLGLRFHTEPSDFDESSVSVTDPGELVQTLAYSKAKTVLDTMVAEKRIPDAGVVVIGADTVVVLQNQVLGKPIDTADARRMLKSLQNETHTVFSGLCVLAYKDGSPPGEASEVVHEKTRVTMQPMDDAQIARYVETGEPLDKAGSYAIQGLGATLISGIEGDYFTVVGLPLHRLAGLLQKFGVSVF